MTNVAARVLPAEEVAAVRRFVPLLRRARAAGWERVSYGNGSYGPYEYVWTLWPPDNPDRFRRAKVTWLYGRLKMGRGELDDPPEWADGFRVKVTDTGLTSEKVAALAEMFGLLPPTERVEHRLGCWDTPKVIIAPANSVHSSDPRDE